MSNKKWFPWALLGGWVFILVAVFNTGGLFGSSGIIEYRGSHRTVANQSRPPRGHVRIIEYRGSHKTVRDWPVRRW